MRSRTVPFFLILVLAVLSQTGCSTSNSPMTNNSSGASNSWSTDSAGAPPYRTALRAAAVGHRLYVIGGQSDFGPDENIRIFDADSDKWLERQDDWWDPRLGATATVVNGKVYLIGGWYDGGSPDTASPIVYDPGYSAAFGVADKIPSTGHYIEREGHAAAAVDGKIYLIGGTTRDSNSWLWTMQVFDVSTSQWSSPLPGPPNGRRWGATACTIAGKIYVFGGDKFEDVEANGYYQGSANLEVYDPATNTWSVPVTTGSPSPREGHTACVVNGKMYVIGGNSSDGKYTYYIDQVDVFDPSTNAWTTPKATGTFSDRSGLGAAVINGKIYTVGGGNNYVKDEQQETYFEVFQP